jgi:RNA-directed DNA polymerase
MTDALTSLDMSTGLRKVADRAKREPAARFHSLAHLIDEELLAGAFARLRSDAAVGVDGIMKEQYGQDLQNKLRDLHERLKTKRYRHQPIRHIVGEDSALMVIRAVKKRRWCVSCESTDNRTRGQS